MFKYSIYEDAAGEFRWTVWHTNGNTIADSSEGYSTKSNAKRAYRKFALALLVAREVPKWTTS